MMSDKIIKIVDNLYQLTDKGVLTWSENEPTSKKRYFERTYVTSGEDETTYKIDIKFSLFSEKWKLESSPSLWIMNSNLPNGMYYVLENDNKYGLENLRSLIMSLYCKDMNPSTKDIEDIFDEICNNINISAIRDNKINYLINKDVI
jgi:hypothetical protein